MSHQIENNMIAYKNETPWHGLGFKVDSNATGIEMLKTAGLDWKVQRRHIAMRDNEGKVMLTEPLNNYRAIVRSDNDVVFQISTDSYNLVQNSEVIDVFREYCELGHASMETVGGLKNGAIVWALAKLNGGTKKTIQGVDELRGYLLFTTSHDGSVRTIGKATQVRVVCWNTLSAALKGGQAFAMKHSKKWTDATKEQAKSQIGIAAEQIMQVNDAAEKLANVRIDHDDWLDFMGKLMGSDSVIDPKTAELTKLAEDIKQATISSPGSDLVTAKGTLWGAVNGVTYFTDHMRGRTQDTRLTSAWFGDSDLLKRSAMNVALEMAGLTL
jgi:phage/plasmid-like protein (TIGR03299 family)